MKALFCLVLALVVPAAAVEGQEHAVDGSYFAVIVADIDVSAAWYRDVFALEEAGRAEEPGRYAIVNLRRQGLWIELLELPGAAERPGNRSQGLFKAGVLVADLGAFVASLPAAVDPPEVITDGANGLLLLQLRDPDGNIVQVMQHMRD